MENNQNGVLITKAYVKHMDEKLDLVYKTKIKKVEKREEWQIHEQNLELKEPIGRGSFCKAYRGVYHNGEESIDVAVKVFEWGEEEKETTEVATSKKAFLQEVSIWYKLEHPNIAKMIGAVYNKAGQGGEIQRFENNGVEVTKYMPGGTLKSYLIERLEKKLPFEIVMKLALGLAKGLSYLHSKKIVHRNVKTEIVLLDEELNVKLTNFKVAYFEPEDSKLDVETTDSRWCKLSGATGTFGYMAPEVFQENLYDHKCDVYSFAICLWEIYCCDNPISLQTSANYEWARPRVPRCCPKSFGKVIVKCWESDPKRRPEMREVVRMLEEIDVSKGKGMTPERFPSCLSCMFRG